MAVGYDIRAEPQHAFPEYARLTRVPLPSETTADNSPLCKLPVKPGRAPLIGGCLWDGDTPTCADS